MRTLRLNGKLLTFAEKYLRHLITATFTDDILINNNAEIQLIDQINRLLCYIGKLDGRPTAKNSL
jgi:hypothetical protein